MYRTTSKTQTLNLNGKTNGGRINLAITGFAGQRLISIEEIKALITCIPGSHLSGLKEISYQPIKHALYPALSRASLCDGEYIEDLRKIVIYEAPDKITIKHIMIHEIGHYVFQHLIDQKLRYHWTTQVSARAKYVTQYAQTNASEDFAECYATYVLNESTLKDIPPKYHFFQTHIFKA